MGRYGESGPIRAGSPAEGLPRALDPQPPSTHPRSRPADRIRDGRAVRAGPGSCWVNQDNIAIADRANPSATVTIARQSLDVAYGPDAAQLLDVYAPAGTTRGTIVYFHSGGWTGGSKTIVPPVVFQQLDRGWAVVSVDYRLAGRPGCRPPRCSPTSTGRSGT